MCGLQSISMKSPGSSTTNRANSKCGKSVHYCTCIMILVKSMAGTNNLLLKDPTAKKCTDKKIPDLQLKN